MPLSTQDGHPHLYLSGQTGLEPDISKRLRYSLLGEIEAGELHDLPPFVEAQWSKAPLAFTTRMQECRETALSLSSSFQGRAASPWVHIVRKT